MTPDTYLNTYRTYKAGTNKITTWLAQAAQRCGVEVNATLSTPEGTNAPTKKGKKASATQKYAIPLKDFVSIAKAIAFSTKPTIRMPNSVVSLIRSVIGLRRQATEFFARMSKSRSSATVQAATAGHRHFITVLEAVLTIFDSSSKDTDDLTSEATNLFDALTVEEPSDAAEAEPAAANLKKKGSSANEAAEYELQTTSDDIVFTIFSFFKDVNDVRQYLQGVWKDYRQGKVDAMSAAVTTDTAFTLLKHSSGDVLEALPGQTKYQGMVAVLNDYLEKLGGASDAFGDWTCLQTANLLKSYEDVLDPGSVPVMKPGHFGVYNAKNDWSKMSDHEKYQEDLIVLLELLPEFTKLSRTKMYVPAQDELTTGLRKMMDANAMDALPMYAIFGTQILLDIHHVLRGDVARPFDQLQATGKRVIMTVDDYFRYSRGKSINNWPAQNDEVFRQVSSLAKDWTTVDRVGKAIVKGVGNVRPQPYHLLRGHPVLCGLLMFRLNMALNDGGIHLCNAWGSVM